MESSQRSGGGGWAGLWFSIQDLLTHALRKFLSQKVRAGQRRGRCPAGRESGVFTESRRHGGKQAPLRSCETEEPGTGFQKLCGKKPRFHNTASLRAGDQQAGEPGLLSAEGQGFSGSFTRSPLSGTSAEAGRPGEQRLSMPSSHAFLRMKPCKGHLREANQERKGKAGWGAGKGTPAEEGGSDGGSSEQKFFENELGLCRSFNEKTADHSDQTKLYGFFFAVVVNNTLKNCCIFF